jgi:hypothetical protein
MMRTTLIVKTRGRVATSFNMLERLFMRLMLLVLLLAVEEAAVAVGEAQARMETMEKVQGAQVMKAMIMPEKVLQVDRQKEGVQACVVDQKREVTPQQRKGKIRKEKYQQ